MTTVFQDKFVSSLFWHSEQPYNIVTDPYVIVAIFLCMKDDDFIKFLCFPNGPMTSFPCIIFIYVKMLSAGTKCYSSFIRTN